MGVGAAYPCASKAFSTAVPNEGHADANLNTITISSDEEDSQVPGGLQEVLVEVLVEVDV